MSHAIPCVCKTANLSASSVGNKYPKGLTFVLGRDGGWLNEAGAEWLLIYYIAAMTDSVLQNRCWWYDIMCTCRYEDGCGSR